MARARPNLWKIIGINLLVFFVSANVFYWGIPTVALISDQIKAWTRASPDVAALPLNPSYSAEDAAWEPTYRREALQHNLSYVSFVGWRSDALNGKTITVGGPYRQRSTVNTNPRTGSKAFFFGGSAMWGISANNAGTIPSQFSDLTGIHSENFGEIGWTAHQSLVLLIQLLQEGHRPDLVVFYDGVNEVSAKCNRAHKPNSHAREAEIVSRLRPVEEVKPNSFSHYAAPVIALAQRIKSQLLKLVSRRLARTVPGAASLSDDMECDSNPDKVDAIAENLLRDWRMAKQLVESHGGRFEAFLQPVIYLSRISDREPEAWLRPEEARLRPEYDAVYPAIERKIRESRVFHSLVAALDGDDSVYTDFCHVVPRGNRRIAQRIADVVGAARHSTGATDSPAGR